MPFASAGTRPNPLLTNPATSGATSGTPFINSLIPGAPALTASAAQNTQNLLSGLPSTSAARKANAVFGVSSGLAPGSDFLKTRLYDTYGQEVDNRNQQGLQNYMALIGALSSPELANRSQNTQADQFNQSLANQKQQFADNLKQRQEEFNRSNDLALQEFGFNRTRYFNSLPRTTGREIPNVSPQVPGGGGTNIAIDQTNAANPQWWY